MNTYISISEASRELKISRPTLYLAIARKKLNSKLIGKVTYIIKDKKYKNYN